LAGAAPPKMALYQKRVDEALRRYFPKPGPYADRVHRAMEYSLFAGGKRLRPLLCLLASQAVGGRWVTALPAACAFEYIHTYSLIHDDLPALDNDDFRRGQQSCHKKFGQATAILAGDALLTEAFALLSRRDVMKTVPPEKRIAVIREIARAAGIQGMVAGQEADLKGEKKKVAVPFLNFIHQHKTGALIAAAVVCGGILGGGQAGALRALRQFGQRIGLAFQIKDDLLNVEGQAHLMGKGIGTDARRKKATYPALFGLEGSRKAAERLLTQANQALSPFGPRAIPLMEVGCYVLTRDR